MAAAAVGVMLLLVGTNLEMSAHANPPTQTPIRHVVIIMQENHSFFNYWAAYPGVIGGLADAKCQKYANGTYLCPYATADPESGGILNHSGFDANVAYDNGKMDGFLKANPNDEVMSYYNSNVLGYYWGLAERYTLNDMFFSSYMSYSLPNHWASVAGNAPTVSIDKMGKYLQNNATTTDLVEQASEIETMLEAAHADRFVTVKYYDEPINYSSLTKAIDLGGDKYVSNYWNPNLEKADTYTTLRSDFVNRTSIFNDISSGNLPAISWVIPNENISEHPPANVTYGEQWVQMVVDAVMNSYYWYDTAIFIMTDDWGAFYDPVVPPTLPNISPGGSGGQIELGFRVSSLLVSPYSNRGIVNTVFSFESVLHFIDYNWGLPPLNQRVAAANNMLSDFDFRQNRLASWLGPPLTQGQINNASALAKLDTPDVD